MRAPRMVALLVRPMTGLSEETGDLLVQYSVCGSNSEGPVDQVRLE